MPCTITAGIPLDCIEGMGGVRTVWVLVSAFKRATFAPRPSVFSFDISYKLEGLVEILVVPGAFAN